MTIICTSTNWLMKTFLSMIFSRESMLGLTYICRGCFQKGKTESNEQKKSYKDNHRSDVINKYSGWLCIG